MDAVIDTQAKQNDKKNGGHGVEGAEIEGGKTECPHKADEQGHTDNDGRHRKAKEK